MAGAAAGAAPGAAAGDAAGSIDEVIFACFSHDVLAAYAAAGVSDAPR